MNWERGIAAAIVTTGLAGCGSFTTPAAVRTNSGQLMVGTATASTAEGKFEVASPRGNLRCSGNYNQYSAARTISAPVVCSDGRVGTVTLNRTADLMSGIGDFKLSDGTRGRAAFGDLAASVIDPPAAAAPRGATTPAPTPAVYTPAPPAASSTGSTTSAGAGVGGSVGRSYQGNCPTPDSYDSAGRRCGARSAASRSGGSSGYSSYRRRRR